MIAGRSRRGGLVGGQVGRRADDRKRPSERAARRVRTGRQMEGARQEPPPRRAAASRAPRASRMTSSLRSSLRSRLRWRGDCVVAARTWSATLPSISRGTSTWPRVPRSSRSRPQSSESAWRSATHRPRVERARPVGRVIRRAAHVTHRRASVRPTAARPPTSAACGRGDRRPGDAGGGELRRGPSRPAAPASWPRRTSSRNASERASRSSAPRTNSRSAASVSRSTSGARRSVGDRLDVEALVGLEQLDRLEADPGPVVRRARDSARTGRRRAAAPSGIARPPRGPGRIRRSGRPRVAGRARRAGASRTSARRGRAPSRRRAARRRGGAARYSGSAAWRSSSERSASSARYQAVAADFERVAQVEPGVPDADLGHDIERPAARQPDGQLRERLEAAAQPRGRLPDALGDRLELAAGRGDERQDAVGLTEVEPRQDDRVGRVAARDGHPGDGTTVRADGPRRRVIRSDGSDE